MSETNKGVVRRLIDEVWNRGELSAIRDLVAAGYSGHTSLGEVRGIKGYEKNVREVRRTFPDFESTVGELTAEGDKVVARCTIQGTHKGDFLGIAGTGRKIMITGVVIYRLAGGKVVEEWEYHNMLSFLRQLGAIPDPDQRELNENLVRRCLEEVWNRGNTAAVGEYMSENCVFHASPLPEVRGVEAYKDLVNSLRGAFPDLHFTIEELITAGDRIVLRYTSQGTHKGKFLGVAPSGRRITLTGTVTHRTAGGKIEQAWVNWDALGFLQQAGAAPGPKAGRKKAVKA